MAGQVAEYRVICCTAPARRDPFVTVRRMQSGRLEMRSAAARVVIDAESGAVQEAYHLGAGPQRSVNLVEMTPVSHDPNDIHPKPAVERKQTSPVGGANNGWTALGGGGSGDWQLASGFLEGSARRGSLELRLSGNQLLWTATGGFRFSSISALPYLPFDRCTDGNEYRWPTGPDPSEPPDSAIGPRPWTSPPGGVFTYYARRENYGALSFVPAHTPSSEALTWVGACSHRMEARAPGSAAVALVFHAWKGDETALVARAEARKVRQPLLVQVSDGSEQNLRASNLIQVAPAPVSAAVSGPPPPFEPRRVAMDGTWDLAWGEKGAGPSSEWRPVKVPGSAHLQWLPRDRVYTREAGWVSGKEWWYRRKFRVPADWKGSRIHLDFEATDYIAEAFLNGAQLGRHEGYIDPYTYDVTSRVKAGEEYELQVRVWTPVHYYWKHRPYTVKGSYGGVDQKPDDITALGITRSVWLRSSKETRITDVAIDTLIEDGDGIVVADVDAGEVPQGATWEVTLTPHTFRGPGTQIRQAARGGRERIEIRVREPRLWWTWDHGKPDLYLLDVRLKDQAGRVLDGKRMRTGIRTVARRGDRFYLNGKPVFLRGTNIYANLFLSEFRRPEYERDFALIRQMNVNSIRVHCHFENPEFYELADEQGFLIWQDYLEAWYPHDTEFSRHAAKLFDRHIRLVRNHTSVFAWAPSDEEDLENYRDLTKHLAARPALLDPQDRWVQRSTGRHGDAHLYFGWYSGSIWDYRKMTANLVTELGATGLPARSSIEKFLPGKWPIPDHADDWAFHHLQVPEAENA
ncbi:MAG: beta galactosidase jelly roll domain-containing protein, partial [Bryobacterales bacterium]|nr:beta galactosidase jelly roll domain-containing protein [Bryobacterales bacterium]